MNLQDTPAKGFQSSTKSEAAHTRTARAAQAIIDSDKSSRDAKTARLRAARLAAEQQPAEPAPKLRAKTRAKRAAK